jgi:hypothetical protein
MSEQVDNNVCRKCSLFLRIVRPLSPIGDPMRNENEAGVVAW